MIARMIGVDYSSYPLLHYACLLDMAIHFSVLIYLRNAPNMDDNDFVAMQTWVLKMLGHVLIWVKVPCGQLSRYFDWSDNLCYPSSNLSTLQKQSNKSCGEEPRPSPGLGMGGYKLWLLTFILPTRPLSSDSSWNQHNKEARRREDKSEW